MFAGAQSIIHQQSDLADAVARTYRRTLDGPPADGELVSERKSVST
jgi:hypothetical protein